MELQSPQMEKCICDVEELNWYDDISGTVSVINKTTNTVTTNITVGSHPIAIGQFIGDKIQKAKLNGSKVKASLSKHKQKKPLQIS
jgi:YVTN family beta-propeller protein